MRMDGYDKWLISAADSQYGDDDEMGFDEYRDEILIGCMNGDDELSEFLTEDCPHLNSPITQILAKHYLRDMDKTTAAMEIFKLLDKQFDISVEKTAEYRNLWSH